MKLKKAFTLVELLVVVSIICLLAGLLFSALTTAKKRVNQKKYGHSTETQSRLSIGEKVYIESMSVTGVINHIHMSTADILVMTTNGVPVTIPNVSVQLLKRVIDAEK